MLYYIAGIPEKKEGVEIVREFFPAAFRENIQGKKASFTMFIAVFAIYFAIYAVYNNITKCQWR